MFQIPALAHDSGFENISPICSINGTPAGTWRSNSKWTKSSLAAPLSAEDIVL